MTRDSADRSSARAVIGPEDPLPYVVLQEQGSAPALLACDHASRAIPRAMQRLGLAEGDTWQHIAWDIGAGELTRGLAHALDAPAVLAGYSRLVVDCNRSPTSAEAFRTESDGRTIPGNRGLTAFDRRLRLASFFDPYHGAITALLAGFRSKGVVPLFLSVHSFTPQMGGRLRPWHIGVLWDRDPANAQWLIDSLRSIEGLVVGDNEPYSGRHPSDYTVTQHAEAAGLPHVCIEVRQDQLESPAGMERWVRLLARLIRPMLEDPALRRAPAEAPAWPRANLR